MHYIIRRKDKIEELKKKNIPPEEKVKKLEEFDNVISCPYRGHKINLRELEDYQWRAGEIRCPKCDEWFICKDADELGGVTVVKPFPRSSSRIKHPDNYECIVNRRFEDPNYIPQGDDSIIWYDRNLNEIRPTGIPIKLGEKAIPLGKGMYVAIKENKI